MARSVQLQQRCECGGTVFVEDYERGEVTCRGCGVVAEKALSPPEVEGSVFPQYAPRLSLQWNHNLGIDEQRSVSELVNFWLRENNGFGMFTSPCPKCGGDVVWRYPRAKILADAMRVDPPYIRRGLEMLAKDLQCLVMDYGHTEAVADKLRRRLEALVSDEKIHEAEQQVLREDFPRLIGQIHPSP